MSKPIIEIKGISKKYALSHQTGRSQYVALRDKLSPDYLLKKLSGKLPKQSAEKEEFWALKDVSFEVQQGEAVGIIGRNGAGKSTMLKVLSKIVSPTEGEIILRGRVASLLEVGTGFHPELTGRENIYLNGAILGMRRKEIERKFDEIVDFSGVEKFLDTPVKRYSSGMYVRLAFAVAAHLEPEILIVDEVLAVGDAEFQKKCLGKMQDVAQNQGRTVLFVSHNMGAISKLCQKSILLSKGTVELIGKSEDVITQYLKKDFNGKNLSVFDFQRPSNIPMWINRVSLCADGKPSSEIYAGQTFTIEVSFNSEKKIKKPKVGFVVYSEQGEALFCANNRFLMGGIFEEGINKGTILCDLGQLPLVDGYYSISFWLGDEGVDYHTIQNAVNFDVIVKDIWGNGKVPPKISPMWWPTRFTAVQNI